ncbi:MULTISPECIES: hypothetical protein [unclassified Candidatus Sulfotelmatobacter]|uniref:hypothetical protein n=1 Tax=unclassified Candidatus Sulfotelmatobacter TaxID=2635724 RepID=UPI001688E65C|nr:hypothetical protein [Kocuria sp. cx-116]MBD2762522.1 hypothetical protein [Kocuria sp. cx-116]
MATATRSRTGGKAPLSAYVLSVLMALVLASLVGAIASVFYDENRVLGFVIFAACSVGTFFVLGWVLFVSTYTVAEDPHAEDNIEHRWYDRATSGAFHDILTTAGIALVVVTITRIEVSGVSVLLLLLILAMISCAVRFWAARRRDS